METWAQILGGRAGGLGPPRTIFQSMSREQIDEHRLTVIGIIREDLRVKFERGELPEKAQEKFEERLVDQSEQTVDTYFHVQAVSAEQTVFNLLLVGNTFEAKDDVWETTQVGGQEVPVRRAKDPQLHPGGAADLFSLRMRTAMNPLSEIIDSTLKPEGQEIPVGAPGRWAWQQVQADSVARTATHYDAVEIVSLANERDAKKSWTAQRTGSGSVVLSAPECVPARQTRRASSGACDQRGEPWRPDTVGPLPGRDRAWQDG